jgi:hypothetical protein
MLCHPRDFESPHRRDERGFTIVMQKACVDEALCAHTPMERKALPSPLHNAERHLI